MDEEFERWWKCEFIGPGSAIGVDKEFAKRVWIESARRAKRAAWKECAETLESNQSCSPVYIAVLIRKELAKPEE